MIPLVILAVLLALLVLGLAVSFDYVKSDEVALRRWFGVFEEKVHRSGIILVPRFLGINLVKIPKKLFRLPYETKSEHLIYTSDKQLASPEVTFYLELPFNDDQVRALILLVEKDVPLTEVALKEWAEDILMPALRQAFSKKIHTALVGDVDTNELNDRVNEILHRPGGVLRECGIMGTDPDDIKPGSGRAYVEVETVSFSPELQAAMQAPVVARYLAEEAKQTAAMNAEQIGGQIFATVAKMAGKTVEQLARDLRSHPEKRGKSTKEKGYAEFFAYAQDQAKRDRAAKNGELTDIRVGNTDGTPMNGELPAFAAAALLLRGGGRGGFGGKGGRDNRDKGSNLDQGVKSAVAPSPTKSLDEMIRARKAEKGVN